MFFLIAWVSFMIEMIREVEDVLFYLGPASQLAIIGMCECFILPAFFDIIPAVPL